VARRVRDKNLETRNARTKLAIRGKPYWKAIHAGLHVGYRKGKCARKWVVRFYLHDGKYKDETIAQADDTADANGADILDFWQAQEKAREKYNEHQRAASAPPEPERPYTVADAINKYLDFLETHRKSAADARYRAEAFIIPELGDITCACLKKEKLQSWLNQMATTAPRLRTRPGQAQKFRESTDNDEARRQRKASSNRVLTILKASLNRGWRDGKIADDRAWRQLEPFEGADAARVRYLTIEECQRLINASDGEFRNLIRAALFTGCRFGELIALEVRDFNPDTGTLHVRASKSGKARHVVLNDEGIKFFTMLRAGRPVSERMLRRTDGASWGKSHQTRPMLEACRRANIDPPIGIHGLRHTFASHAVMAGAPLLVVAKALGHRDTRMCEAHYAHLSPSYFADQIRAAAPRFGTPDDTNTMPIRGVR
jgi:integrase